MESKSAPRRLKTRDRENQALDLRRKGYTHRQIAEEMGCCENTSYSLVKRALERLNTALKEKADEVRAMEVERYDAYLKALQPAIDEGDVKAITTALRVSEARRRLLGVDVAVKHEVEIKQNLAPDQLAQVKEELLKRLNKFPDSPSIG